MKNIGFIGFGNMAQAMAIGFIASGKAESLRMNENENSFESKYSLFAFAPNQSKLQDNCGRIGVMPCETAAELVQKCDTVFMACKPYQIEDVIAGLKSEALEDLKAKQICSVAAGWDYEKYKGVLPEETKIQCIMPNTPVAVSKGVFLVAEENNWEQDEKAELLALLGSVGKVVELPTRLMDAGMAVSGCGPAFMDMIIEAIADGAVKNGIQRKQAYELACQTMIGSAELMMQTGIHPGQLKDNVCSPGGTTIKGVAALEEAGIRSAFIKAIDAVLK